MDHIRLPVDYPLIENEGWPGNYSEEGLGWIDRAIDWCEAAGLWCILDMHNLPGHVFSRSIAPLIPYSILITDEQTRHGSMAHAGAAIHGEKGRL